MTDPRDRTEIDPTTIDGLTELEGEELMEVVRQTVDDLQQMLDRLRRYLGEDEWGKAEGEGS